MGLEYLYYKLPTGETVKRGYWGESGKKAELSSMKSKGGTLLESTKLTSSGTEKKKTVKKTTEIKEELPTPFIKDTSSSPPGSPKTIYESGVLEPTVKKPDIGTVKLDEPTTQIGGTSTPTSLTKGITKTPSTKPTESLKVKQVKTKTPEPTISTYKTGGTPEEAYDFIKKKAEPQKAEQLRISTFPSSVVPQDLQTGLVEQKYQEAYLSLTPKERIEYNVRFLDWSSMPISEAKSYEGFPEYFQTLTEPQQEERIQEYISTPEFEKHLESPRGNIEYRAVGLSIARKGLSPLDMVGTVVFDPEKIKPTLSKSILTGKSVWVDLVPQVKTSMIISEALLATILGLPAAGEFILKKTTDISLPKEISPLKFMEDRFIVETPSLFQATFTEGMSRIGWMERQQAEHGWEQIKQNPLEAGLATGVELFAGLKLSKVGKYYKPKVKNIFGKTVKGVSGVFDKYTGGRRADIRMAKSQIRTQDVLRSSIEYFEGATLPSKIKSGISGFVSKKRFWQYDAVDILKKEGTYKDVIKTEFLESGQVVTWSEEVFEGFYPGADRGHFTTSRPAYGKGVLSQISTREQMMGKFDRFAGYGASDVYSSTWDLYRSVTPEPSVKTSSLFRYRSLDLETGLYPDEFLKSNVDFIGVKGKEGYKTPAKVDYRSKTFDADMGGDGFLLTKTREVGKGVYDAGVYDTVAPSHWRGVYDVPVDSVVSPISKTVFKTTPVFPGVRKTDMYDTGSVLAPVFDMGSMLDYEADLFTGEINKFKKDVSYRSDLRTFNVTDQNFDTVIRQGYRQDVDSVLGLKSGSMLDHMMETVSLSKFKTDFSLTFKTVAKVDFDTKYKPKVPKVKKPKFIFPVEPSSSDTDFKDVLSFKRKKKKGSRYKIHPVELLRIRV